MKYSDLFTRNDEGMLQINEALRDELTKMAE
jgi:hypothetical protein